VTKWIRRVFFDLDIRVPGLSVKVIGIESIREELLIGGKGRRGLLLMIDTGGRSPAFHGRYVSMHWRRLHF
jgi:hypothetical protein